MIASVDNRFVFLCNPKTGSTAVEKAFGPFAEFRVGGWPKWKHVKYDQVRKIFGGYFENNGCKIYAIVRNPIDGLLSWYKYRARDELKNPNHPFSINYTGGISFDQFVEEWGMDAPPSRAKVPAATDFVLRWDGTIAPINLYRYEDLDVLWSVLSEHVGQTPEKIQANMSPRMEVKFDRDQLAKVPKMQRALEIYEKIEFAK